MKKQIAISILEEIKDSIKNGKEAGLNTLKLYEKNLKIATDKKIQKLIEKQKELKKKYGENRTKDNKNERKRVIKSIRKNKTIIKK